MRRSILHVTLCASLLAALGPSLAANDSKPASGTEFNLLVTQIQVIQILGFAGCKFEVEATSSNDKVASVSFNADTQSKKHKVMVTGESAGTAMITVTTMNSENLGCQGFEFTFPVTVTPDKKAFLKEGKSMLKASSKQLASELNEYLAAYCDSLDDVLDLVKAGEFTFEEVIDVLAEESYVIGRDLDLLANAAADEAFSAVWAGPGAAGFTVVDEDFLRFLPGGCGDWDKYQSNLQAQADKAAKKIRAKLKKTIKQLNKAAQEVDAVLLLLNQIFYGPFGFVTPVPLPADPPQMPAPPTPKPLRKTSVTSGRLSTAGVTRLDIGGIGDADGGQVTVSIVGPDGFNDSEMVDLDKACGFHASFDGIKPGHYTVTLTQNGVTTTFTTVAA